MERKTWIAAGLVLALAACGRSEDGSGGNAAAGAAGSQGSASASASGAGGTPTASTAGTRLRPGLYETAMEMKIAGLPASVGQAMNGTKMTSRNCITPEEANRPSGDLFAGEKREGCESKNLAYEAGRVRGTMTCTGKRPGEGTSTFTMDGTYGSDSFDVRTRVVTEAQGARMTMEGHTVGRRVGDCPAGDENS